MKKLVKINLKDLLEENSNKELLEKLYNLYEECFPKSDAKNEIESCPKENVATFLLKNDENELIGFFIYVENDIDIYEILDLGIAKSERMKGLGKYLFNQFFDEVINNFKNKTSVFLEVAENNKPAIALYEKLGFKQYNVRKNYYNIGNNRVNALLFRKII